MTELRLDRDIWRTRCYQPAKFFSIFKYSRDLGPIGTTTVLLSGGQDISYNYDRTSQIVTVVPLCAFGIVFGSFLASIGDETSGTTITNGIFNTVLSFTGLAANRLLQTMSYRKVGLIGAALFFIGCFGTVFVTNLAQMIVSFGIIQGLGFGLMMPASFTAFNKYFDKKKNVMMGIAQAIIVAVTIGWPALTKILMEEYGFRGTVLIFSGLSLNCFVAMLVLQPVEWHYIKVPATTEMKIIDNFNKESVDTKEKLPEEKTLLEQPANEDHIKYSYEKPRPSVVSIGSMAISTNNLNKIKSSNSNQSLWQKISEALDLALFKDPVYVNIAFGLSLSLTADLAFLSIIPLVLTNLGFSTAEITLIMTVYFICDLVSRIFLSVLSAVIDVKNRYVFLIGTLLSAAFRLAFVMDDSLTYILVVTGALGFLRCFIQTPLPLVVAEEYPERFTTAFSLYMVVCGVVSLIMGPLMGFVKAITQSDQMVVHVLTVAYLLCGIPWTIELIVRKLKRDKPSREN